MDKELWSVWNGQHDSEDQKKRLASAKKSNMTPVSIDRENGTGKFSGSTMYDTSLDSCTCIDFTRRQLPCKHMYRLAIELGILNESAKSDTSKIRVQKSERASLEPVIEIIESLTESQISLLHDLMKEILFIDHKPVVAFKTQDSDELVAQGLMIITENVDDILNKLTRSDLISILEDFGLSGFKKNAKKTDIIKYAKENVDDINALVDDRYTLGINNKLQGIQKKVYTYLMRRNDTEEYYDPDTDDFIEIPKGAEFYARTSITYDMRKNAKTINAAHQSDGMGLRFPDDEITDLLNKYEKNRCNDW